MAEQTARSGGHDWRDRILTEPDLILEDRDLMRVLFAANDGALGRNVVDMRGIAMERLEARLDRLEDTHRSVIAAAYENHAGTNQINRCVLRLLDCDDFAALLDLLAGDMADILRVDRIRLVLESGETASAPHPAVSVVPAGFVHDYIARGRDGPARQVSLRSCAPGSREVFGTAAERIRSEALLRLDLGAGRLPSLLAIGSEDETQFSPAQGSELLVFLAETLGRIARRHLDAR